MAITVQHVDRDRLRIEVRGHELFVDQPVDDGGDDSAPTPTELLVASLAACIGFYAERFMRRHGLATDGLRISCSYSWAENPHRVGEIQLDVDAPSLTQAKRVAFTRVIEHCTVHNTLAQPPVVQINVASAQMAAA